MKILQIDDVFHPAAGYTSNIISKYFVQNGHKTRIITSVLDKIPDELTAFFGNSNIEEQDAQFTADYGVEIRRLPIRAYISGRSIYYARQLEKEITDYAPDILYIHGNDSWGAYWCLRNRKKFKVAMVSDSHMLDMAGRNPFRKYYHAWYRKVVAPIIVKNHILVIRIQDDDYVERRLGVPLSQAPLISVGSDTLLFHQNHEARINFRKNNNISADAFVILYAGKLDESKGGMLLAEAIHDKIQTDRTVEFVIVGNAVGEYGSKVETLFRDSRNEVHRFPTQRYSDLAPFYQASDVAVFPRQCSLSFYDVQACGLPVVFEDNNINKDRACYGNALLFKSGDCADFRFRMKQLAEMSELEYHEMSQSAIEMVRKDYDYQTISKRYLEIFEKSIEEQMNLNVHEKR